MLKRHGSARDYPRIVYLCERCSMCSILTAVWRRVCVFSKVYLFGDVIGGETRVSRGPGPALANRHGAET